MQTSTSSSQWVGNQLFTFCHTLSDILDNHILENGLYLEEPRRFYYTILHKLRNVLDAGSFLIVNLDGKPHYTDAAYLLLRTCLLDVACLYYVLDATGNQLQAERIDQIMYDHIRSLYISARDEDEKVLIRSRYPQCFHLDAFRKDIKNVSIKKMFNEITNEALKTEVGYSISLYNIFSKTEHNGILSFHLLHDHFSETGGKTSKKKIYDSLGIIMVAINLVVQEWVAEDTASVINLKSITKEILAVP